MDFNVLNLNQLRKIADEYKLNVDKSNKKRLVGGINENLEIKEDGTISKKGSAKQEEPEQESKYKTGGKIQYISKKANPMLQTKGTLNPFNTKSLSKVSPNIPNYDNPQNPANEDAPRLKQLRGVNELPVKFSKKQIEYLNNALHAYHKK
jgi:hypothetical protein